MQDATRFRGYEMLFDAHFGKAVESEEEATRSLDLGELSTDPNTHAESDGHWRQVSSTSSARGFTSHQAKKSGLQTSVSRCDECCQVLLLCSYNRVLCSFDLLYSEEVEV